MQNEFSVTVWIVRGVNGLTESVVRFYVTYRVCNVKGLREAKTAAKDMAMTEYPNWLYVGVSSIKRVK